MKGFLALVINGQNTGIYKPGQLKLEIRQRLARIIFSKVVFAVWWVMSVIWVCSHLIFM